MVFHSSCLFLDLLEHIHNLGNDGDEAGGGGGNEQKEEVRKRRGSLGRNSSQDNRDSEPREKEYTDDQLSSVNR